MKVSVVLPAYNAEKYLKETIDSILNQTFTDFELIIVNDCSTDKTEDIIKSYTDSRIVYVKNDVNLGISDALNKGIAIAQGEYIARMDADDISLPTRFEKQVKYLDLNLDISLVATDLIIFGEGLDERVREFAHNPVTLKCDALFDSPVAHPSVMIRKSVFCEKKLKYNNKYNGIEDYYLWWDMLLAGYKLAGIDEPLLKYRKHASQVTQNISQKVKNQTIEFGKKRLEVFQIEFTDEEYMLFAKYISDKSTFSSEEIYKYVDFTLKLQKANLETGFFDKRGLQKVLMLSFLIIVKNKNDKKALYNYAVKNNLFSIKYRISMFVRFLLNR